jgi:hypothetical protein
MGAVLPLDSEPVAITKPLLEAISVIQKSAYKLALIVDSEKKLVGTVTDNFCLNTVHFLFFCSSVDILKFRSATAIVPTYFNNVRD